MSAILPETYIQDVHTRLIVYKRIANAKSKAQLRDLQVEMIDRFGLLPEPAKQLLLVTELKFEAENLGIKKISASQQTGKIDFIEQPKINIQTLLKFIQLHAKRYQMEGPTRLRFTLDKTTNEERIHEIHELLCELSK